MPTTKIRFVNVIVFFRVGGHCQCSDIVPCGAVSVVPGRRYIIKFLNKTDWTEGGSPAFFNPKIMRELFVKVVWQVQPTCNIEIAIYLNVNGKGVLSQGRHEQMKFASYCGCAAKTTESASFCCISTYKALRFFKYILLTPLCNLGCLFILYHKFVKLILVLLYTDRFLFYTKRIAILQETATFSTVTSHKSRLQNSYILPCAYLPKYSQNICIKCLLPLRNWHFFFAIKK